ncbi:MAG: hypothetical protein ACJ77K_02280 [Bacteroidia bacterium]
METLTNTHLKVKSIRVEKTKEIAEPSAFWKQAEENRLGITPVILLVAGIIGGIAAATGIMDSWVKLAAVAFPSTILLALILSIAPMRAIYIGAAIALVLDLLVIFF